MSKRLVAVGRVSNGRITLDHVSADMARADVIRLARELDASTMDAETCAIGPGRYEGADDLELLVAVDVIYMNGGADATAGSVEFGRHGARVDRYVNWADDRGFITLETFDTETVAQDALDAEDSVQNPEEEM